MKVRLAHIKTGCIISNNIFVHTGFPILKENTILTEEHLTVLKAFLIETINVEPMLANGEKFRSAEIIDANGEVTKIENGKVHETDKRFLYLYLEAVKDFKKIYTSWQAGHRVEMVKVRKLLLPLFDGVIDHSDDLLILHHYSDKEDYIIHHSLYVGILSAFLGYKLEYKKGDWLQIGFAGALADIGMSKISPEIMKKNASLTPTEFEEVKKHPIYGYKMLKDVAGVSDLVLLAILQHHERLDGSGYPLGADSRKIHAFSQVIAVADVYHAMTSERYYRSKRSPYQVLEELTKEQFGKFDVKVIGTLMDSLMQLSVGKRVRLTSGEEAEIVFFNRQNPTRPLVRLQSNGKIIELAQEESLFISDIL